MLDLMMTKWGTVWRSLRIMAALRNARICNLNKLKVTKEKGRVQNKSLMVLNISLATRTSYHQVHKAWFAHKHQKTYQSEITPQTWICKNTAEKAMVMMKRAKATVTARSLPFKDTTRRRSLTCFLSRIAPTSWTVNRIAVAICQMTTKRTALNITRISKIPPTKTASWENQNNLN